MWLVGTLALLTGYVFQAAALDRGRLVIIQPLLVTTIVFALPLGYFLTRQHVGRREVIGAAVILCGLALFAVFGDPAGGRDNAPGGEWALAIAVLAVVCGILVVFGGSRGLTMKAAVYGTVAGILFGLSAALTKPTLDYLHAGIDELLSHWEPYTLAIAACSGSCSSRSRSAPGDWRPRSPRSRSRTGRRHPARHLPAGRAVEQARVARRRRLHRPRAGARRRGRHLARAGNKARRPVRCAGGRRRDGMSRRSTERSDDVVLGEARWHMAGAVLAAMVLTILAAGRRAVGAEVAAAADRRGVARGRDRGRPGQDQPPLALASRAFDRARVSARARRAVGHRAADRRAHPRRCGDELGE